MDELSDELDDGDDGDSTTRPLNLEEGTLLMEGRVQRREIVGAKVSSWKESFFSLRSTGLLVVFKSAKKSKAQEAWRFPDGCFYRRMVEEECEGEP